MKSREEFRQRWRLTLIGLGAEGLMLPAKMRDEKVLHITELPGFVDKLLEEMYEYLGAGAEVSAGAATAVAGKSAVGAPGPKAAGPGKVVGGNHQADHRGGAVADNRRVGG